jgi:hypothetical protein
MARIEAEVTADIKPFERALRAAATQAREFAEKTKDVGKDVFKEAGAGKMFNMSGMSGATVAATAFGAAIIETAKEGLDAYGHLQTKVLELTANLKDPEVAEKMREFLKTLAIGAEDTDHLQAAFISLNESGLGIEESGKLLQDLQAWALRSGEAVDGLAEAFRRASAGGLDAGEGASRLLKSIAGLAPEIEKHKDEMVEMLQNYAKYAGPGAAPLEFQGKKINSGQAGQLAEEFKSMTAADFVKKGFLKKDLLEKLVHESASRDELGRDTTKSDPLYLKREELLREMENAAKYSDGKGKSALELVEQKRGTIEGKEGEASKVIESIKEEVGKPLESALDKFVNSLTDNAPQIKDAAGKLGKYLGEAGMAIENFLLHVTSKEHIEVPIASPVARFLKDLNEKEYNFEHGIVTDKTKDLMPDTHGNQDINHRYSLSEMVQILKGSTDEQKKTNDLLGRALTVSQ